jgi:hypothetical protein
MAEPWYESVSRDLHESRSAIADILGAEAPESTADGDGREAGAHQYARDRHSTAESGADVFPRSRTMKALMRGHVPPALAVTGVALMLVSPMLRRQVLRALPLPVLTRKLIGSLRGH